MAKKKRVLKRSKTGIETEFILIDSKGKVSNKAAEIISKLKKINPNFNVTSEIGKSMIEFNSYPDVRTYNPALDLINSLEVANDICDKKSLLLYPFSTYPGKYEPQLNRSKSIYKLKEKIFGKEKNKIACSVTGFHHHYTLPKSVFDAEQKMVRFLRRSKLEHSMVSSYNFEIAADPVLTLFTQSSPFYMGKHFAKDTRVVVYRGGKKLLNMDGLYAKMQQIGGLPPYKQTATDLLHSLTRRWKRWEREVMKVDKKVNFNLIYPFMLDIGWHPVKLNKHGTLEQRGMDINFLSTIIAVSVLLKFCLMRIQREFIEVIPADFAIDEAFKRENNVLYIPPHSYVRNKLQAWSAYEGFDNKEMYHYAKRFFYFARSMTPKRYTKVIRPIYDMIENKKSMSDRILKYAKYKGYVNNGRINKKDSAELALYYAKQFPKDLEKTKKALMKLAAL